jgi:hypothetical protein
MKHSEFVRENFGKRVEVNAKYFRSHYYQKRIWIELKMSPKQGLLIGLRYLMDGYVQWYEDHSEWNPEGDTIPAYLVVLDHNTNPIYVPVENLSLLEIEVK